MKKMTRCKGQELVEFALILPVMLVVLVAIAELGFMWTLRGTVSDAVKSSVQQMQLIAGMDQTNAANLLQTNIQTYLTNHGVPNAGSVQVTLADDANNNTVVSVTYEYNPTFTLPNFFGIQLLPDTMRMGSSQVINSAIFGPNNYSVGDTIQPAVASTSILQDDPTAGDYLRKQMAFLIDGQGDVTKIVNWWGHDVMPANAGIHLQNGTMVVKSPTGASEGWTDLGNGWYDTGQSYAPVLLANGYTTVIYSDAPASIDVSSTELPGPAKIFNGDLGTDPSLAWCTPGSAGASTCDGDITADANNTLLANSVYNIGSGYEVLPPVPTASPSDQVTLPSSDLVPDDTARSVSYDINDDPLFQKLKFYVPKTSTGDTVFNPPANDTSFDLTNSSDRDTLVGMTVDWDGDGIPNAFDSYPENPDADSNGEIDGYQTDQFAATGVDNYTYTYTDNMVEGKAASFGNSTLTVGLNGKTATTLAAGDFLDASQIAAYADTTCANGGGGAKCGEDRPYFLAIKSPYTTTSGDQIEFMNDFSDLSFSYSEKCREPDPNKKVFVVQVMSRDAGVHDLDLELSNGGGIPVDDDVDDDGDNDKFDTVAAVDAGGNFMTGLLFVNNNVGGMNFNPGGSASNMGYQSWDPEDNNADPEYNLFNPAATSMNPARKADIP